MTDPDHEPIRRLPDGLVRIGDAEREEAASALGDHFAAGRLDRDEFDARLSAAYAARSGPEIAALFADLPDPRPRQVALHRPGGAPRPARVPSLLPALFVVVVLVPIIVASVAAAAHGFPPFFAIALAWLWFGGRRHRRVGH